MRSIAEEFKNASELIPKVSETKDLRSTGLQLERAGHLEQSAMAFGKASDWESLVRVLLNVNLDVETKIAREHPQEKVCRLVAQRCIQLGNYLFDHGNQIMHFESPNFII